MEMRFAMLFEIQFALLNHSLISHTLVLQEVTCMAFRIKSDRKETENKTIRFPLELIARIEKAIVNKDVSFSGFVIQACEYALSSMEKE